VTLVAAVNDLIPRLGHPGAELLRRDIEKQQQVIVRGAAPLVLLPPEGRSFTKPPGKPFSESP
jgi:hypothetical protein